MKSFSVNDKIKAYYDQFYSEESEWRRLGAVDKVNNIISLCDKYPHKRILDIGAGEGSVLKRLSDLKFGKYLSAVEISKSAHAIIRKRNIKNLVRCELFDGYNIPFEDNTFDLVILSHVIEHCEFPRKILYEASRVGRYIFVEVPLEDNMRRKHDFVFQKTGHINFYSQKTIRWLLQTCGLEVLKQSISNISYKAHKYLFGKKAFFRYWPKQMMVKLMPGIATKLVTFHCSLLCTQEKKQDLYR